MNQEIKLPPLPETEYLLGIPARPYESEWISSDSAWDDSAMQAYATAAVELDRAQRGEPVLWRYRDSEQVIRAMDGYTPVEGWTPLYTATQPAHTEAEVQEILDSSLREWGVFEQTVRIILNVEKP